MNNMPLVVGALVVGAIVVFMVTRKKDEQPMPEFTPTPVDPCIKPDGTKIPDWACQSLKLIKPLAKTGLDIYKIKKGVA